MRQYLLSEILLGAGVKNSFKSIASRAVSPSNKNLSTKICVPARHKHSINQEKHAEKNNRAVQMRLTCRAET